MAIPRQLRRQLPRELPVPSANRYNAMEMASPRTYTQDLLPESALPEELAEQGLYKPAGMGCEHCEFATKKTGLSGRQALRAHLKRPMLGPGEDR